MASISLLCLGGAVLGGSLGVPGEREQPLRAEREMPCPDREEALRSSARRMARRLSERNDRVLWGRKLCRAQVT
ncbi:hypothetical protein Taro_055006 [Colocasia esculenta]|uniref:Uncharacterized protein n=1 Tax=Colocasia esculenta TaxID=4460 RepID=A0A843XQC6_COLES|nr:hypothetical protein [Colocasia esculenta]